MMAIFTQKSLPEGDVFLKWVNSRISKNKNVITVTTGATGSGKSYVDLRRAELHHRRFFKEEFPIKNCCFSVAELMERIQSKDIRKGEVLILEEAGVNAGSGDWQNKVVKMFNYILQSFRSMNIVLFLNLPVLTMLAKQARQLVHMHMTTVGIDVNENLCKIKPLFHQLNQHSGKSYWKYIRIKINGKTIAVKEMKFNLPSLSLINAYESKKQMFLDEITNEFTQSLRKLEQDKLDKLARIKLTPVQERIRDLYREGKSQTEIAQIMHVSQPNISGHINRMKRFGYNLEKTS